MIPSYPKIFAFGSRIPVHPFDGKPAVFQEKVDGSQFSFGMVDGELQMRSKGQEQSLDVCDGMFRLAVESAHERGAPEGVVFRCEYLNKPKHNTLAYDRVPAGNLVVFDVYQRDNAGLWDYLAPDPAEALAVQVGLEYVPTWQDTITTADQILAMLDRESFLGGPNIEGVVMKRYDLIVPQFTTPLFCKYVSERFKEKHSTDWKNRNPSGKDFLGMLADTYRTEARWRKAIQHMRERGELVDGPQDIGPLMKEINVDVRDEIEEEAKQALFDHWWKTYAARTVGRGFPEWYKELLLRESFTEAS